jgi:sugar lactone lactonase YvrE
MNVDSKGNLYVTEVQDGKRVQKFVFKGMVPVPTHYISPTFPTGRKNRIEST